MPKTHLKKFYQEQEHGSSKSGQDQTCSANKLHVKKEHNSFSAGKKLYKSYLPRWIDDLTTYYTIIKAIEKMIYVFRKSTYLVKSSNSL